jgi:hypothetical protein
MTIDQRFDSTSPPLLPTYSHHHHSPSHHDRPNFPSSSSHDLDHYYYPDLGPEPSHGNPNMAINLDVDPDSVWRDFPPQPATASSSYMYDMQQQQQQQQQHHHQQHSQHSQHSHSDHRQHPPHPHSYAQMNQPQHAQHPIHPQHRYSNEHPPPMIKTYSDDYTRDPQHNGYTQGYHHDHGQADGLGYDPYHPAPPPSHPNAHPYANSGSGSGSGSSPGQGLQTRPTTADNQYQRQDQYQHPHSQAHTSGQSYHPQQPQETSSGPSPINPREAGGDGMNTGAGSAGTHGNGMDQPPTSPQGGGNSSTNKKRRHNVGKACENCRRR